MARGEVFRRGGGWAVQLPAGLSLPPGEVEVWWVGASIVIGPVGEQGISDDELARAYREAGAEMQADPLFDLDSGHGLSSADEPYS